MRGEAGARQRVGAVRWVASGLGRLLHAVLVVTVGVVALAGIVAVVLAWRLSQGPIDLAWAARRIEAAVNTADSPSRLSIGSAAVSWAGFAAGPRRGLELLLHDVRVVDRATGKVTSAGRLELTLAPQRLLRGDVIPLTIGASGVELHLVRGADRVTRLDFGGLDLGSGGGPAASVSDSMAELSRPARGSGNPAPPALQHLEQLGRVRLSDSVLVLDDQALGATWRLALGALDLQRAAEGGVHGTANATLELGAARASVAMQAALGPAGATEIKLQLAPVAAASVQHEATQQGAIDTDGLYGLDAAVQAAATLSLSPTLLPTAATLHAEAGSGSMRIAGLAIGFDSLDVDAAAQWERPGWTRPSRLDVSRARGVVRTASGGWPTTIEARGEVHASGARLAGNVAASVDHLAFADIPSLWPVRLSGHTRPWITQNLTGGTARDGTVAVQFEAGADFKGFVIRAIDARLAGDDVTIWWFRPAPPVEHAQAVLTMKTPDALEIAVAGGRQGPMALSNGVVRITGLDVKDQFLALTAEAAGQTADLITLLRHKRLGLLDRRPIPMKNPGGAFSGRLGVNLPLNDDLQIEQVRIQAQARFANLHLGGAVAGRDIDRGDVQLDATSESLKAAGHAMVGGIPADLSVEMMFQNGGPAQIIERANATATATAAQLTGAGLDPGGLMSSGAGLFTAVYAQRRDAGAELQVTADLRHAGLALPGWTKPAGVAADARARLLIRGERLVGIDRLSAQGPGMAIEGRAEMVGDRPLTLVLDRMSIGTTQATGRINFPAGPRDPIRVTLAGPRLDLSGQFASKPGPAAPRKPEPPGTPWVADLRFDRVVLAGQQSLAAVEAHAENDGARVTALRLVSTGPERVEASIRAERTAQGAGRRVSVHAADAGAVLRALDVLKSVRGGKLALEARYDDSVADPPLAGSVEITDFHVQDAPVLGKLLQAVTVYGVVDALSGPGLAFSDLVLPFRYGGGLLDINDARAFSSSLGLTAKGRVDQNRQTLDLQGTVVPAYVLNSLLGRIPVLGRIFSAERGGGLVAVNYAARGPVASPRITANPLSALTPGFLRGLFHILE